MNECKNVRCDASDKLSLTSSFFFSPTHHLPRKHPSDSTNGLVLPTAAWSPPIDDPSHHSLVLSSGSDSTSISLGPDSMPRLEKRVLTFNVQPRARVRVRREVWSLMITLVMPVNILMKSNLSRFCRCRSDKRKRGNSGDSRWDRLRKGKATDPVYSTSCKSAT